MFLVAVGVWLQVQAGVQMGTLVRPETVTVGQHFAAVVHVRAPRGSMIEAPPAPDSMGAVAAAAAPGRRDVTGADYVDATLTYVLAAWDVGAQQLGLGDVLVRTSAGERRIPLSTLRVFVRSVLPADTTLRKPKPARPGIPEPFALSHRWLVWALIALAVLLLVWLLWLAWRRRRGRQTTEDQLVWAEREFRRVEAMHLLEHGRTEQHAVLMAEVLRGYLVRQFARVHRSATTHELVNPLRGESAIPADRVLSLFERVDLLKFAGALVSSIDADAIGAESRALALQIAERYHAAFGAQQLGAGTSGTRSGGEATADPEITTARRA